VLKCLRRIPASETKKIEEVRPDLEREILENKLKEAVHNVMKELHDQATPQLLPKQQKDGDAMYQDSSCHVLAYIHGKQAVTREELGEYLIARFGPTSLDLLVNKLVVERVCKEKGIAASESEIDAAFAEDCALLKVDKNGFVQKFLKPYGKTLYEWREDADRPKILLSKLCHNDVKVTEADLKLAFEAYNGEQVECQMILWPRGEEHIARKIYNRIRTDADEFNRYARQQPSSELSSHEGRLPPFGRHTFGNEEVEKIAFKLKEGELSPVMTVPEGVAVLKCVRHIPPKADVTLEQKRPELEKEVFAKKLQARMPVAVEELRKQAHPTLLLKGLTTEEELKRAVEEELQSSGVHVPRPQQTQPQGN
jgi:hypothetical protein